jgi:hypothetical protein
VINAVSLQRNIGLLYNAQRPPSDISAKVGGTFACKRDSFVKSAGFSLLPENYTGKKINNIEPTKVDVTENPANTSELQQANAPERLSNVSHLLDAYANEGVAASISNGPVGVSEEPLNLTQEQIDFYFSIMRDFPVGDSEYDVYLPLIHASDDVKKAWIETIDELAAQEIKPNYYKVANAKDAVAAGYGFFTNLSTEQLINFDKAGINKQFGDFKSMIESAIDYLNDLYRQYLADPASFGDFTIGYKAEADYYQVVLDMFEKNHDKYKK